MFELNFRTTTVEEITKAYLSEGCVLLRNFVDTESIPNLQAVLGDLYKEIEGPHVYAADFTERGLPPPHAYLFSTKHDALLRSVYGNFAFGVYWGTSSRQIDTTDSLAPGWQSPLKPHVDAFYHDMPFTVNFWVPFVNCGVDAPGLGVVCADFGTVAKYCGYDGREGPPEHGKWNFSYFKQEMWDLANGQPHAVERFHSTFENRIWLPTYNRGDAMMMSNWTLHFTHATPEMQMKRRQSMELRFLGEARLVEILSEHGIVHV
jgi:hypothetical protein